MGKHTVEVLVDGGKATAGPPLGSQLGPLKVDVAGIVKEINDKTRDLAGMKVPVKVVVDTDTKSFRIAVGTPPAADLIKKELGIQKGSGEAGITRAGDLAEEQVKRIARMKFGSDDAPYANQIRGTCRSMGVTIGRGGITDDERKATEMRKKAAEDAKAAAAAAAAPAAGTAPSAEEKKA
jgi:large subunit ribosomal protein L11